MRSPDGAPTRDLRIRNALGIARSTVPDMSPESAVVISAALSAAVAISSLAISAWRSELSERRLAERDDRVRAEDLRRADSHLNLEERRALYAELLRVAASLPRQIEKLGWEVAMSKGGKSTQRDEMRSRVAAYDELVGRLEVTAIDRRVIQTGEELAELARQAALDGFIFLGDDDEVEKARTSLRAGLEAATAVLPRLRSACRADLGFQDGLSRPTQSATGQAPHS